MGLQTVILCASLALAAGRLYAPTAAKGVANETSKVAKVVEAKPHVVAAAKNSTASKMTNLTADEQMTNLEAGLNSISKLRNVFTAPDPTIPADKADLMNFASGAMTAELSNKNSKVWTTIETMLGATKKLMGDMKGKSKDEQEKMMGSLETELDGKAMALKNITDKASVTQEQHSEEYLLGVLMQHTNDWSFEKQLNATKTFTTNCKAAAELVKHHNASQPLAPQLAALMDAAKAHSAGKVAAEKSAAHLFVQLVSSLKTARA